MICFPLGVIAYLKTANPPPHIAVKNFSETINKYPESGAIIHIENKTFNIPKKTIQNWLEPYIRSYTGKEDVRFTDALDAFLSGVSASFSKNPVDAKFIIDNGKAVILSQAQEGEELDVISSAQEIRKSILSNQKEITLTTKKTEPSITEEKIRSLGVDDRLAIGESNFSGSTLARIQNIKVASKKFNGLIIKPGETFSFNTILGEVVASTGYAPEKVIKNNKIEYEYGGGVCQVSTTLFRAAIFAGLPIVERRGHAFPVHYYEPQGFDATIYPGSSDLRFTNDTPGPILIQTHIVGKNINFEIYGKTDGRVVKVDGPHQYDQKPDGSMKAYFVRDITFVSGATSSHRFDSLYKSPALYVTEPNPYQ
ncbi:MAG: VanW family protein [Candidatus Pacebacteria bacterium]|nr:VanW family protein [Candidatus Paceibacterota bacterium]